MDNLIWLQKFQKYIYTRISPLAIPEGSVNYKKLRLKLVDEQSMAYWVRSVTHSSFNPNQESNYETLEYVGDGVMGMHFTLLLTAKYPDIDQGTLTDLKNKKVWKKEQANLSIKLGIGEYVRSIIEIDENMREDLLEAFFGALMLIGDNLFGEGNGYAMTRNIMIFLYDNVTTSYDITELKNEKNQLKEIGDKLHWLKAPSSLDQFGVPEELLNEYGKRKGWRLIFKLTPSAIAWLRKHNYKIKNEGKIADVTGKTKDDVETNATKEALSNLKEYYKIDWYEADKLKERTGLPPQVVEKMAKENFDDIEIVKLKSQYYQLIAYKFVKDIKNGREIVKPTPFPLITLINKGVVDNKEVEKFIYNLYVTEATHNYLDVVELVT